MAEMETKLTERANQRTSPPASVQSAPSRHTPNLTYDPDTHTIVFVADAQQNSQPKSCNSARYSEHVNTTLERKANFKPGQQTPDQMVRTISGKRQISGEHSAVPGVSYLRSMERRAVSQDLADRMFPRYDDDPRTRERGDRELIDRRSRCAYSPRFWSALACFTSTLSFLAAVNTDYLPKIETMFLGNLLPDIWLSTNTELNPVILIIIMWSVHFFRRYAEILFLDDVQKHISLWQVLFANIYYPAFGFWIGWSCNYFTDYWTPANSVLVPGFFIFCVGEAGSCYCHVMAKRTRRNTEHGGAASILLSRFIHAKSGFDILTWLGFAVASCTFAATALLTLNFLAFVITLAIDKMKSNKANVTRFIFGWI